MDGVELEEELKKATEYMVKIRSNPQEFERWVDKVMEGWLKRKSYRRSSETLKAR